MQSQLSAPAPSKAREGSPWTGLWAVVAKEMADYLTSTRMLILELLTVLTAAGTVFSATQSLRENAGQSTFLFLQLFTASRDPLPAFVGFLGFLVPLIAFFTIIGSYAIENNVNDVTAKLVLGVFAWIIGRATGSVFAQFFGRPISLGIIVMIIVTLGFPYFVRRRNARRAGTAPV